MLMPEATQSDDLRQIAAQRWGRPLAANHFAGLWRCPRCAANRSSSLMVVTDVQFRCLGRCGSAGGLAEFQAMAADTAERVVPAREG